MQWSKCIYIHTTTGAPAKYAGTSPPFFGTWSGNLMVFIYKWHQKNGGLMQILVQGQFSSLEINWSPLTMDLIFNPQIIFLVVLINLMLYCCKIHVESPQEIIFNILLFEFSALGPCMSQWSECEKVVSWKIFLEAGYRT